MSGHPAVDVVLATVAADNWRACADLRVSEQQSGFVAPVTRYLALCSYDDGPWVPWAVLVDGVIVGFVMSAYDQGEDHDWVGGLVVDHQHQGRGIGRAIVSLLVTRARAAGRSGISLSVDSANERARLLYRDLGFVETDERVDDEIVARHPLH